MCLSNIYTLPRYRVPDPESPRRCFVTSILHQHCLFLITSPPCCEPEVLNQKDPQSRPQETMTDSHPYVTSTDRLSKKQLEGFLFHLVLLEHCGRRSHDHTNSSFRDHFSSSCRSTSAPTRRPMRSTRSPQPFRPLPPPPSQQALQSSWRRRRST